MMTQRARKLPKEHRKSEMDQRSGRKSLWPYTRISPLSTLYGVPRGMGWAWATLRSTRGHTICSSISVLGQMERSFLFEYLKSNLIPSTYSVSHSCMCMHTHAYISAYVVYTCMYSCVCMHVGTYVYVCRGLRLTMHVFLCCCLIFERFSHWTRSSAIQQD